MRRQHQQREWRRSASRCSQAAADLEDGGEAALHPPSLRKHQNLRDGDLHGHSRALVPRLHSHVPASQIGQVTIMLHVLVYTVSYLCEFYLILVSTAISYI